MSKPLSVTITDRAKERFEDWKKMTGYRQDDALSHILENVDFRAIQEAIIATEEPCAAVIARERRNSK